MPRPKYTHEQLIIAHKKQMKNLGTARLDMKYWKERAKTAEHKLMEYVIVDDKPDYWYSMSGFTLFRRYYRTYGLLASQMEVLMMISYVETFFAYDYRIFKDSNIGVAKRLLELIELRYVVKIKLPSKNSFKRKNAHVLTQRGKDLIADYKKFYDEKMEEIRNKRVGQLCFSDGAYFKRTKVNAYYRKLLKGGPHVRLGVHEKDNDLYSDNDVYEH